MQEGNMSAAKMLSLSREKELRAIPTCVADVMTRNVVTLAPNQTFADAVTLMASKSFRHFLVVHPDGRLAGILSDRDIFRAMGRVKDWQARTVKEVMTCDPYTVTPQTSLSVTVGEVLSRRINCLPVVDDQGKVCGILTSTDLLSVYQKLQVCFDKVLAEVFQQAAKSQAQRAEH